MIAMSATATVRLHVDYREPTDPGSVAVLLDLLEARGLKSGWSLPPNADTDLLDRLRFGGQAVVNEEVDALRMEASTIEIDPLAWLHEVQIAVGRALEERSEVALHIDTATLQRSDTMSAVAEALDLVAGLVRAGRVSVGPAA